MTDDTKRKLVAVEISEAALQAAHAVARLTGAVGLTDRQAVECLIVAHVKEFNALAAAIAESAATAPKH